MPVVIWVPAEVPAGEQPAALLADASNELGFDEAAPPERARARRLFSRRCHGALQTLTSV